MDLSFANPAGFWALLALPMVLGIHFLQRRSRRVITSTLFLFDALNPISAQGSRIERLRNSLPLWLQIAAVILLAWLLAGPRWLRRDSSQRIVVVLDSSVSMLAFRDELIHALPSRLHSLERTAAKTEWHLLETDPARPTLYAGTELPALLAALDRWTPHLGTHDFVPALSAAHGMAREAGVAVFVTDRKTDVPDGVETLAVGHLLDNCGWVGVTVDGDRWRALVQNHSASAQTRSWRLESGGASGAETALTLAAGQIRTLGGVFPVGKDRCELVLTADGFPLDDRLPIVRAEPKRILLSVGGRKETAELFHRLAGSVPNTEIVADSRTADVQLDVFTPDHTVNAYVPILFAPPAPPSTVYLPGELLAENTPLTAGLIWNGLLCKQTNPIPQQSGDEPLVWQGDRALIFVRHAEGGSSRALCVNFDVLQSNADRLPAFVVLLSRFIESARAEAPGYERLNVETNQLLDVASDPAGPPLRMPDGDAVLRAPFTPRFFEVKQGERVLLDAASHFADAREADFKAAGAVDTLEGKTARMREHNSREDFLWPFFALALGAVFLANWATTGRGRNRTATRVGGGLPG